MSSYCFTGMKDMQKLEKAMELSSNDEPYLLFCLSELPSYQGQEVHVPTNKYTALLKNRVWQLTDISFYSSLKL